MDEKKDLKIKFNTYIEKVKNIKTNISDEDKLILYSNYKQALFGDNLKDKPSIFNRIEIEKWKSWKLLEGVSENKAMKTYIRKVREIIDQNKI
jgi:acyl-CoA-binding protein